MRILLEAYARFPPDDGTGPDREIERLKKIRDRGFLQQFILYEAGAQGLVSPILLMPVELQQKMERFIAEFVVVDARK